MSVCTPIAKRNQWNRAQHICIICIALMVGCAGSTNPTTDDTDGTPEGCVQDDAGHAACNDELGWAGYCGPDGDCIEASGCEAENCCVPGAQGDDYCASLYGPESVCVADTDGYCSQ